MFHDPTGPSGPGSVRRRIYHILYEARDFQSRQTLARQCQISLPTLYQNLGELMENGLVRYSGEERSTRGRKVRGLTIVPEARFAVGISVTADRLRLSAADLRLREMAYQKVPIDDASQILRRPGAVAEILDSFLDAHGLDRARLLGVGIAVPGILTPEGDRILNAPTLRLRDQPLDALTASIPYPVYVENDASSSGYAEWFVRGRQRDLAYLSLEDGVGGALLIGGKPYGGDRRRSGEFGHICVEPGGLPCSCGRRGCLEAYCSARRISDDLGLSLREFFRLAGDHSPEHETLLYDLLRHLAIGIHDIHMALDCDVVLGGFLTSYLGPWIPALETYVAAYSPFGEDTSFVQSSVLRHIAPLGAALFFIREFVDDP